MIERVVDGLRGLETAGAPHEREEEVGVLFEGLLLCEVMGAEAGLRVRCEETALATAGGKVMSAASLWCDGFTASSGMA